MSRHAAVLLILTLMMTPAAYGQPQTPSSFDLGEAIGGFLTALWDAVTDLLPTAEDGSGAEPEGEDEGGVPNALPIIVPTG